MFLNCLFSRLDSRLLVVTIASVFCITPLSAQTSTAVQTAEAIELDETLSAEMKDYRERERALYSSLEGKSKEERAAALKKWEEDHKAWNKSWNERRNRLVSIWNWGNEAEKEKTVEKFEFEMASRELVRIRAALLAQGVEALKAAMRDPQSEYSRQKAFASQKHKVLKQSRQKQGE